MKVLEFWFDFASTYSYLSAMRVEEVAHAKGVEIRWMPFLLGPVFAKHGWDTSPFNIYPVKGRYMWRDMERLCDEQGLDLKQPATFPQFTLLAARVGVAGASEPWLGEFCRNLFVAEYGRGEDITSPQAVSAALPVAAGDPSVWLARAGEQGTKDALKQRVEHAMSIGIFGAPTFVAPDEELFWGNDRLEAAVAWTERSGINGATS